MSGQPARRPGELVFLVLLLVLGILAIVEAHRLGGFAELSGPGFFPMLASLAAVLSLSAIIWRRLKEGAPFAALDRFFIDVLPLRLIVVVALIAAYVAVMPWFGFLVASGGFLLVMLLYLWRQGFWRALAVAVASLVAVQVVFRLLFQVVLPKGQLWPAGLF